MRGGQHAGRAEAALEGVMLAEGGLQRGQCFLGRETLNGDDATAFSLDRQHQARADGGAVDDDCACAAHPMFAAASITPYSAASARPAC